MDSTKVIREFLPQRITFARESAGLSLGDAARLLGFNNYQILSNIEKGAREVKAHELSAMASLYGRDLAFFFETASKDDPIPLWRKSSGCDIRRVQREFRSFLESYNNLEEILGLKKRWKDIQKNYDKSDFRSRRFELTEKLSQEVWKSLALGSRPAFSLLNVLENDFRFKVLHLPLPSDISGASVVSDQLGVGILINSTDVPWRRHYDLAHELFHIITWGTFTHDEVGDGSTKTEPEQYADAFASGLLLPETHLRKALDEISADGKIRILDIIELAIDFGVSTDAVLWRLNNLGKLKKDQVERILGDPGLRGIDRSMRRSRFHSEAPPVFPTRFISLACKCLNEGRISRGTFAKYMKIDIAEVDTYLRDQGFPEETYESIGSA